MAGEGGVIHQGDVLREGPGRNRPQGMHCAFLLSVYNPAPPYRPDTEPGEDFTTFYRSEIDGTSWGYIDPSYDASSSALRGQPRG